MQIVMLQIKTYIFDGYPRNIDQAKALDEQFLKVLSSKAIFLILI